MRMEGSPHKAGMISFYSLSHIQTKCSNGRALQAGDSSRGPTTTLTSSKAFFIIKVLRFAGTVRLMAAGVRGRSVPHALR